MISGCAAKFCCWCAQLFRRPRSLSDDGEIGKFNDSRRPGTRLYRLLQSRGVRCPSPPGLIRRVYLPVGSVLDSLIEVTSGQLCSGGCITISTDPGVNLRYRTWCICPFHQSPVSLQSEINRDQYCSPSIRQCGLYCSLSRAKLFKVRRHKSPQHW